MKRKIFFISLFLIFSFYLNIITPVFAANKYYKDKYDRYSLLLPDGWRYYQDDGDVFFEYESNSSYASLHVYGYPVEKYEKITLDQLASQSENYDYNQDGWEVHSRVLKKVKTEVDSSSAIMVHQKAELKDVFEGKVLTNITIIDEYYFIKNNHAYILTFSVSENSYYIMKKVFEHIVNSFKAGPEPFKTEDIDIRE